MPFKVGGKTRVRIALSYCPKRTLLDIAFPTCTARRLGWAVTLGESDDNGLRRRAHKMDGQAGRPDSVYG